MPGSSRRATRSRGSNCFLLANRATERSEAFTVRSCSACTDSTSPSMPARFARKLSDEGSTADSKTCMRALLLRGWPNLKRLY